MNTVTPIKSIDFMNATNAYSSNTTEKREQAVKVAVHASNVNHKQKQADIYISSMDDNSNVSPASSPSSVDPIDAYRSAMKYQNKQDFISIVEQVGEGEFQKPVEIPADIENMI